MAERHVLFVSSWYPTHSQSAGTFVELHLLALQSRGVKCALLLNGEATLGNFIRSGRKRDGFLPFRRRDDITIIENLTIHKWPLRLKKDPLAYRKANILNSAEKAVKRYILEEGKPDLIFHHGIFDYCYLTRFLWETFDLPVWYLENSPNLSPESFPCGNPFDTENDQKAFVHLVERRLAVTHAYVAHMEALFGEKFELCPNVITDDFFVDPSQFKRPADYFQFINVAILTPRKNQKLIIEAFAIQFRGDRRYSLVIAGDGPLLDDLKKQAADLGVTDQVRILGFQSRDKLIKLLDESHCFVLSSHSETFGVVLIEAMARGIPAISTRIDGPTEIVSDQNGILTEPNDLESMAVAMRTVANDVERFSPAQIIDSVKSRFGPDAVFKALFK